MAQNSSIEWTEATWNPVTGCTKVSPGCKHCYAERMARRLQLMGQPNYRQGFAVTLQEQMLELPLRWKAPRKVFVNSMSDLFHEKVPVEFIQRVFDAMRRANWAGRNCRSPPCPGQEPGSEPSRPERQTNRRISSFNLLFRWWPIMPGPRELSCGLTRTGGKNYNRLGRFFRTGA